MNKIFRVIWNHTAQRFDVVSELTKTKGKTSSKTDKRVSLSKVAFAVGMSVAGLSIGNDAQAAVTTTSQLVNSYCLAQGGSPSNCAEQHIYQTGTSGQTNFVAYSTGTKAALGVGAQVDDHAVAVGNASNASSYSVAVGKSATATNISTAVGESAKATGQRATALGNNANASGQYSTAVGNHSKAIADNATALGGDATANQVGSVALGNGARTDAVTSTPNHTIVGTNVTFAGGSAYSTLSVGNSTAKRTITNVAAGRLSPTSTDAINGSQLYTIASALEQQVSNTYFHTYTDANQGRGGNAQTNLGLITDAAGATGLKSVTAGVNTTASGTNSIAIGNTSSASVGASIAIGNVATASKLNATAIGNQANAANNNTVAIGSSATALAAQAIAIGRNANVSKDGASMAIAIGDNAMASGANAFAIGSNATSSEKLALAIGSEANATSTAASAYGYQANAKGHRSVALGARTNSSGNASTVLGYNSTVTGNYSSSIGMGNNVTANNTFVLGNNVTSTADNNVILGNGSSESSATATNGRPNTITDATVGRLTYTSANFAGLTAAGVVSVGAQGAERRIINVAAGNISATSTDAINGSQLYHVAEKLDASIGSLTFKAEKTGNGQDTDANGQKWDTNTNKTVTITSTQRYGEGANRYTGDNIEVYRQQNTTGDTEFHILMKEIPNFKGADMGGGKITNVGPGTDPSDAVNLSQLNATKTYVKSGDLNTTSVTVSDNATTGGKDFTVKVETGGADIANNGSGFIRGNDKDAEGKKLITVKEAVDLVNDAGWTTKNSDGKTVWVDPGDQVLYNNGTGTTVRITNSTSGGDDVVNISFDVNSTTFAGTGEDGSTTKGDTNGITSSGSVAAPTNTDGFVKAGDLQNTLNNMGWNIFEDNVNQTESTKKDRVVAGDNVVFTDGQNTKVTVNSDGTNTTIKYDVDLSQIQNPVVYTNATGEKVVKGQDGKWYKAADLDGATFDGTKYVKNGKDVTALSDEETVKITASMNDATNNNKPQETKLGNVANGEIKDGSKDAINGGQLYNYVKVNGTAATKDGSVNFVNGNGTEVKLDPATGNISYNVLNTTLTTNKNGSIATPSTSVANNFVTAGDLVNTLNSMGWRITSAKDAGTVSGTQSEQLIKAGDLVKLIAGDNIDIKQEGNNFTFSTTAPKNGKDGDTITVKDNGDGTYTYTVTGADGEVKNTTTIKNGEKGDTGAQGAQGEKGEKGDTGAQGPQGEKAEKGDTGAQGVQGEKGEKGDTGAQGPQGEKGEKGDTGAQGAQGEKGEKGDTGAQGPQGEKGEKGDTGAQGAQGEKGEKGDTGAQGAQGEKGEKGDTGAQGAQGKKGEKGDTGAQGPQGEKGEKGDAGAQGPQGEKGEKGDTGAQGAQGEKGEKGDTGAQGAQGEKGEKGDTGAQGPQGEKGEKGDTGAQGPQGEKGEKGDTGAQGAQGEKGEKGDTGAQGAQGEKGEKGDTGAQGAQGEKGEKGDTGAQGAQGEKGEKGDTGAQGAQGEKGEKGDTGAQGAQGEKGEKGDTGAQGPQGEKGEDGKDANANITDNGDGTHTITINNPDGTTSTSVVKDGKDGVDGKSATATVTPGEDGKSSIITVTNPDGTTTTSVVKDGAKGDKGDKGEDGKDAKANIADNGDGTHTITINNPDGTTSTSVVKDGAKGDKGDKGEDGKDAKANIADNGDGTHTITINNPDGTTSTSVVKDGINGKDGTEENVVAGNSITVTSKDRPNTGKEFEVSLNDKVTVGQKENGSLVVKNAGDDTQITIENGTITIKTADGNNAVIALDKGTTTVDEKDGGKPVERMTYTSKDASGKETKRELATMDDGLVFAGDSGKDSNRKLGSKVTVSGGQKDASKLSNKPNIGVVSDGKGTLSVKLAKDIDLTSEGSVTVGGTTVKNDGVRIAKGPSLTTNGIDAGGKKITNVAPGRIAADSKDAVNGSQLHAVKNDINNVNNKVDKLDKRVRGIGASAAASSSLPQVYSAGRSMVAAAAGNYSGASAVAVGYSRASDNGKLILKLQGTANSEGHFSSGVGVGYQW